MEIWAQLQNRGFESVKCEKLSVQEQAEVFSSAEVVVGAHGAALTNLVFCRPGTRVVELFSPTYVNPCYRDLCVAAGLRHAAVIGNGEDWVLSERHDQPSAPITASWELVEQALVEIVR
jgi:capsular polysaccharide biosynthesis protein